MSCEAGKTCCTGKCAGSCSSNAVKRYEISMNTIVELEIFYSESNEAKMPAYIFEGLYCLTNTQSKELKITGLEGNRYNSLDIMGSEVIDKLTQIDSSAGEAYRNADISFINDDV